MIIGWIADITNLLTRARQDPIGVYVHRNHKMAWIDVGRMNARRERPGFISPLGYLIHEPSSYAAMQAHQPRPCGRQVVRQEEGDLLHFAEQTQEQHRETAAVKSRH